MSSADVSTLVGTLTGPLIAVVGTLVLSISNYIKSHTHDKYLLAFANDIAVLKSKFGDINPDKIKQAIAVAETVDPNLGKTIDAHDAQIKEANNKVLDIINRLQAIENSGIIPAEKLARRA